MSFEISKLGELGEKSFGIMKLGEFGEMSFGMSKLDELFFTCLEICIHFF